MKDVAAGQFFDDGDAMFETIETNVALWLEICGGGIGPCYT
jgi:hypothetical protein